MVSFATIVGLGAIAGFTIYFGLAASKIRIMKIQTRYVLSAIATGILIFLIYDVLSNSWSLVENSVLAFAASGGSPGTAIEYLLVFFAGLGFGVLGLSAYERHYVSMPSRNGNGVPGSRVSTDPYRFSMMIAVGIGAHNFGEGLAIGNSFASGAISLALVLVIGFGLHNSTEGFGIMGPLVKQSETPSNRFLLYAGLVGGGPTFLGTVIGSFWASDIAKILFLSFAAGALIYVTLVMYRSIEGSLPGGRLMGGIFTGITLGFLTDLIVSIGGA